MKVVVSAELIKSLNKKKDAAQLNYFKKELIKVLEKNDEEIVSKAIEDYDNSIKKTYSEIGIEKAGYGIGTVRVWKGQKFRKIAPGKWRRIYDSNTRGARQSINIIKKKIANAQSIDELLQLVMENTNRFMDADGKLLPIVEELQNAVKESKGRLNTGKPSTQEQIDKIKEENNKKYNPVKAAIGDYVFIHDKYKGFASHEFKDDEQKLNEAERFMEEMKDLKSRINKMQNNFTYENNSLGLSDEEYDELTNTVGKLNNNINQFETVIDGLKHKIQTEKQKDLINAENIENLTEEEKADIQIFEQEINDFINSKTYFGVEYGLRELCKNSKASIEAGRKWLKQHDLFSFEDLCDYVIKKIADKENEKKQKKADERNEKIKQINEDNIKTYSDTEIQKAFEEVDKLKDELAASKDRVRNYNIEKKENKIAYNNRTAELKQKGYNRWDKEFTEDEEFQRIEKKDLELWQRQKELIAERDELDKKLSQYMGPIAYYYLNKFEYEADPAIDSCEDTKSVVELIKSKDWYTEEGNNRLAIDDIDVNAAKGVFKCMERIFAIFPEQKGYNVSLKTNYSNSNTWACASTQTGITFNSKYYKNYSELRKDYDNTEGGFHPMGTNADDIVFHEYFHVMTTGRNLASKIKQNVTKALKMRGKKGGPKQDDVIRYGISEYATKNADEFGAECFCQALGSKNPTAFAIEVFKETLKYIKYMR